MAAPLQSVPDLSAPPPPYNIHEAPDDNAAIRDATARLRRLIANCTQREYLIRNQIKLTKAEHDIFKSLASEARHIDWFAVGSIDFGSVHMVISSRLWNEVALPSFGLGIPFATVGRILCRYPCSIDESGESQAVRKGNLGLLLSEVATRLIEDRDCVIPAVSDEGSEYRVDLVRMNAWIQKQWFNKLESPSAFEASEGALKVLKILVNENSGGYVRKCARWTRSYRRYWTGQFELESGRGPPMRDIWRTARLLVMSKTYRLPAEKTYVPTSDILYSMITQSVSRYDRPKSIADWQRGLSRQSTGSFVLGWLEHCSIL